MKAANAVMRALAAEVAASRLASHTSLIWTTASEVIVNSHQSIQRAASSTILPAVKWAVSHPGTAATCGTAGLGMVLAVAPAAVATPALGALGFGTGGIVGGSWAAATHSTIGSAVSPSLFATLQSAGAGGYGLAVVYPTIQGIGAAITSFAGAAAARSTFGL
ncbi:hypothetical protein PCL_10532 [Purpureocillium lilacinum]|uniref:Uncharacterized protein n=1 Tax=Purpureocillium lilacinum TaxID=33203 RepID=A0A2U3DQ26_PURLI|nr:hypothetical protein PCL_10532 [Purpureocillium lilacinum]